MNSSYHSNSRKSSHLNSSRVKELEDWLQKYQLSFEDLSLFHLALTHKSFNNESEHFYGDNQRLEYLGDSVLGLIINRYLYLNYPDYREGEMASAKSRLVSEAALAKAARKIKLGPLLWMGKGENNSGGRERSSSLADALEAVLGAIYLDGGFETARDFLLSIMEDQLKAIHEPRKERDSKTILQEAVQKKHHTLPVYELISESGPDHAREFLMKITINGKEWGRGKGSSRKKAEQHAAREALSRFHNS